MADAEIQGGDSGPPRGPFGLPWIVVIGGAAAVGFIILKGKGSQDGSGGVAAPGSSTNAALGQLQYQNLQLQGQLGQIAQGLSGQLDSQSAALAAAQQQNAQYFGNIYTQNSQYYTNLDTKLNTIYGNALQQNQYFGNIYGQVSGLYHLTENQSFGAQQAAWLTATNSLQHGNGYGLYRSLGANSAQPRDYNAQLRAA